MKIEIERAHPFTERWNVTIRVEKISDKYLLRLLNELDHSIERYVQGSKEVETDEKP